MIRIGKPYMYITMWAFKKSMDGFTPDLNIGCWNAREGVGRWKRGKIKRLVWKCLWGLPWCRSCWESACQCGGRGFEPWCGRIPLAVEWLDPYAATAGPALWSPRAAATEAGVPGARAPQRERQLQWEARAPQLEKAHAQQQRPNAAKNK